MKSINTLLLAAFVLSVLVAPLHATNTTVNILAGDIVTRSGDRGQFYVLNVSLPDKLDGNRLDGAVIEFAVDVVVRSEEDSLITPVVGVYPLIQPFVDRGEASTPMFEELVPSARPVALGEHRILRMDITRVVRRWMSEPSSNYGLVIGTLTGPNVGTVALSNAALGSQAIVAKIRFFYQNRSAGRLNE